jgi:hypothetical protein
MECTISCPAGYFNSRFCHALMRAGLLIPVKSNFASEHFDADIAVWSGIDTLNPTRKYEQE